MREQLRAAWEFLLALVTRFREERVTQTAVRRVQQRNLLEVGGVWIDEGFEASMKAVTVKAMSAAYSTSDAYPLMSDPMASATGESWPLARMSARTRIEYATPARRATAP